MRNLWYCNASDALGLLDAARQFEADGLILEFDVSDELPCHGWNWVFHDLATYSGMAGFEKPAEDKDFTLRLRGSVNRIIGEAAKRDIEVYIMCPELSCPESFLRMRPELGDPAGDSMYEFAASRLAEIYDALPGLAGIKLYLDEGTLNINDLDSPVPASERMYRVVSGLLRVSREKGRELIVSTFALMPHQMRAITEALKRIPPCPGLLVDNYICPGDWGRVRLRNPAIGDVGGHPELLSFDYCGEIWGQSVIPLCQAKFIYDGLREARTRSTSIIGIAGYVSWTGKALGTPSESTVYAASRIAKGEATDPDKLVLEWSSRRYGSEAGPYVASTLSKTWDIVMKSWHDLGFWVQELPKSELADLAWYNWSLHWESLAIWDAANKPVERMLFRPTEETVARVVAEKDEAVQLAEEAVSEIEKTRGMLASDEHGELMRYFRRELTMCRVFRLYSEAFYRARMFYAGDASQGTRIRELIGGMRKIADEVEAPDDAGFWTCRPDRISLCAGQLEDILEGGEWPEVGGDWVVSKWNEQLRAWGHETS